MDIVPRQPIDCVRILFQRIAEDSNPGIHHQNIQRVALAHLCNHGVAVRTVCQNCLAARLGRYRPAPLPRARLWRGQLADPTDALGINPPSPYAAFGNKTGLYRRVPDRYVGADAIPLADLLRPDCPVPESLAAVLDDAAHRYAADPAANRPAIWAPDWSGPLGANRDQAAVLTDGGAFSSSNWLGLRYRSAEWRRLAGRHPSRHISPPRSQSRPRLNQDGYPLSKPPGSRSDEPSHL